jgi:DnaJ homolog subfamily C member 1
MVFLILVTSAMHYLVQKISYGSDLKRIERFQSDAKLAAWGPKLTPIEGKRKARVPVGPARVDEDGNMFAARAIDMVVEGSGAVYIVRMFFLQDRFRGRPH